MNILYRRVNLNDINEILHLFNQVFKSKLSKEYYLSKYLQNKIITMLPNSQCNNCILKGDPVIFLVK